MPIKQKINPLTGKFDMVIDPVEHIRHIELLDMPDITGANTDHDARYARQGLDAAKGVAGIAGRRYWATDTEILYWDNGAAWVEMVRGESVTRLAQLAERDHTSLTNVLPDQHHARSHVITAVGDHTSGATPGQILQANVNGLPVDATLTDAQLVAIAAAAHARQHAITAALDHTSGATPGKILKADANGLPIDASNTDIQVAAAVAASHAQIHKDTHKTGGGDAFVVADLLDGIARIKVRKNTGADVGSRRRLNLIEGANITLTVADDVGGEEVDVTVAAAGGVVSHPLLANLNWAAAGHTIDAAVDFATFKAITMACDNGATLPVAPVIGQWFLHTPTGRKVLMQYSGTAWIPIISIGTMTMYVDNTDGTDVADKGGAVDAGAFKTIQYAVDIVPPIFTGNVTININNETYAESVVVGGKKPSGDYWLRLVGTMNSQATGTATSKTTGGGFVAGTLTKVGAFGAYDNMLIEITGEAETKAQLITAIGAGNLKRIIDSDTADVITLVGCFSDTTHLDYTIWDWGTEVSSICPGTGQINLVIENIKLTSTWAVAVPAMAEVFVVYCKSTAYMGVTSKAICSIVVYFSLFVNSTYHAIYLYGGGSVAVYGTKASVSAAACALILTTGSIGTVEYGSIFETPTKQGYGLFIYGGAIINLWSEATAPSGKCISRNNAIGAYAAVVGSLINASYFGFSGNTVDTLLESGEDQGQLKLKECAAAPTAVAAYGYLYVDNGTPNDLWWEDDAGNKEQLSAASAAYLFLWDKTTRRIVGSQKYATWDTVPKETGGFIEALGKLWDLNNYEYKLYPPQSYNPPYQTVIVGQTDKGEPITQQQVIWNTITIDSLNLRDFTASELPRSMHIAALKAVDVATKKATVIRKWMGINYEIADCRVSLIAYEHYQAGKIKVFNPAYPITAPQNADCFVLVYFISENPYDTAIEIPVIVDKVVK
jgi:hypothetical protein